TSQPSSVLAAARTFEKSDSSVVTTRIVRSPSPMGAIPRGFFGARGSSRACPMRREASTLRSGSELLDPLGRDVVVGVDALNVLEVLERRDEAQDLARVLLF